MELFNSIVNAGLWLWAILLISLLIYLAAKGYKLFFLILGSICVMFLLFVGGVSAATIFVSIMLFAIGSGVALVGGTIMVILLIGLSPLIVLIQWLV
jgi:hypothetical protein